MRKLIAVALAIGVVLSLAACGNESQAQLEKEAHFSKTCIADGGRVYYYGFSEEYIGCSFAKDN